MKVLLFTVALQSLRIWLSPFGTTTISAAHSLCVTFSTIPACCNRPNSLSTASLTANGIGHGLWNTGVVPGHTFSLAWKCLMVPKPSANTSLYYFKKTSTQAWLLVYRIARPIAFQTSWKCSNQLCPNKLGPSPWTTIKPSSFAWEPCCNCVTI